ncbi:MAG: hypothetical protein HKP48_09340 [Winogradskyella sp.]|uniref:MORN repeat-containing protein n=1 Tax=Winogradskyella sp. TaxID=1883156 RepID=UPI00181A5802|nr:hypothetical protein [Winogradskyella sp.]MBT8244253.1 hypothetical protein [Winogradskyella sp.]NNK23474.1 hypothetical protein [Winogradskyella sp.]
MKKIALVVVLTIQTMCLIAQSPLEIIHITNLDTITWSKNSEGFNYTVYNENNIKLNGFTDIGYLGTDDLAIFHKMSRTVLVLPSFKNVVNNQLQKGEILLKNTSDNFYVTTPKSYKIYIKDKAETCPVTNVNDSYVAYSERDNKTYLLSDIRKFPNWGAKSVYPLQNSPENTYWYRDIETKSYGIIKKGKAIDYSNVKSKKDENNLVITENGTEKYLLKNYYNSASYRFTPIQYITSSTATDVTDDLNTNRTSNTDCVSGNCKNGWGKRKYDNGDFYEGFWLNFKQNGYGLYKWKTKSTYIGNWENGSRKGYGTFTAENGDIKKGEFKNGRLSGVAVKKNSGTWQQGVFESGKLVTKYNFYGNNKDTGCISGDCYNKYGRYKWSNGDSFIGFFKNGKLHIGTLTFANGDKYSGQFGSKGKRNGMGRFWYKNGSYYGGEWRNDLYNGKGYFSSSSSVKKGVWSDGVFIKSL